MGKKITGLIFIFLMSIVELSLYALDPTFGTGGIVTTSIDRDDVINGTVIQPITNSILAAGVASSSAVNRLLIARYTSLGVLDPTFNTTGFQTTLIGSRTEGLGVDLQSDNRPVVCGFAVESQTNIAVVRYNTDGSLDTAFNTTGFVTTSVGVGAAAHSVKVQGDGNIVVGGTSVTSQSQFTLARYTSTGSLDGTFGSSGIVTTPIEIQSSIAQIALQADGRIVAGGYSSDGIISFALARYNTDGSLDTAFGSSGIVTTSIGSEARIRSIAIQSDGAIVVAGFAIVSGIKQFAVARYTSAGVLDTTFNTTGIVLTNIQDHSEANAVAIQTDGDIVVGGFSIGATAVEFALVRYLTTGALDATFGTGGIELTIIPLGSVDSTSVVNSVSIGLYILAAGFSNRDVALAAYVI